MTSSGSVRIRDRFTLVRQLGAGGMGVVYEALDLSSGMPVALKTMRAPSSDALLRFKTEFRALQDIHHPNLVTLLELLAEGGEWWFSMELVRGENFLAHVRRPDRVSESVLLADSADAFVPPVSPIPGALAPTEELSKQLDAHIASPVSIRAGQVDERKLRAALEQLIEGLHALHVASKVHRDLKPENVLVTAEGRVVILDFGLIGEVQQRESAVVGTIAYMAPEQAAGRSVGPAADWYSVGALLYEALTGRVPFEGAALQVLADKQVQVPPAPAELVAGLPADLNALCMELLRTEPAERPDYAELVRRLKPAAAQAAEVEVSGHFFVGRAQESDALERAFQAARNEQGQLVLLHGESGVGKSALMRRFATELARKVPELLVLSGRCYEHEMVPFKAVDGVMDSLAKALRRLPQAAVAALLPRRAALLARVFPVLGLVPAIAQVQTADDNTPDPHEQRNRFFTAFRGLLTRVAEYRPLIILIDDLQWTDSDSLALLHRLMMPPDEPPLLLLATVRSRAPMLKDSWLDPEKAQPGIHHLDIDRLPKQDAIELAQRLLKVSPAASPISAQQLVEETAGHPLFLRALAYHAVSQGLTAAARLDDAVWERVQKLPLSAQRLLYLTALMSRPMPLDLAARASGCDPQELSRSIAQLRVGYLLRASSLVSTSGASDRDIQAVEPYHDRVREIIVARLQKSQQQELHRTLAAIMEERGDADPEVLTYHFEQAGLGEKAAAYARKAAEVAASALAFERAARFYRLTLRLMEHTAADERLLYRSLGHALAHSGRGQEAGEAYLSAASSAQDLEQRELRTLAADQLMRSGRISDGVKLLRELLASLGITYPETAGDAKLQLRWTMLRLRLRGLKYTERPAESIPPEQLLRIDVCRAAAGALSLCDLMRGALFRAKFFQLALDVGEPYRLALGAILEGIILSTGGASGEPASRKLLELAQEVMARNGHPHLEVMLLLSEASINHNLGRWQKSRELFEQAEVELRSKCTGIAWEIGNARIFATRCSLHMGEFERVARRLPADLEEATLRGDLYSQLCLRLTALSRLHLIHDNPAAARQVVVETEKLADLREYPLQLLYAEHAHMECDLYMGRGQDAMRRLQAEQKHIKTHHMTRAQVVRIGVGDMHGRCALLAAAQSRTGEQRHWLKDAATAARAIEDEDAAWAQPLAKRIRASILALQGDAKRASQLMATAAAELDALNMRVHAATARHRQGQLLGGTQGEALIREAEAAMRSERIRDPRRFAALLMPGFVSE